jgi:outer membrane protein TolC
MNEKQIDIQEKAIDLDGKNKIELTSNANIYSNNDYGQSTITTAVTYDIFNYRNVHNFDTNKTSNIIGVSKDLKDFFVSEKDYNKRIILYTRESTKITNLQTINTDVIALIDLYVSYLNSKEEKRVNEELVNTYKVDKNVKRTAYDVGLGSLYDSELSKVNFENASNNIMFYDYKMKNIIEEIRKNYNINILASEDTLKEFTEKNYDINNEYFNSIYDTNVRNSEVALKKSEEELKYLKDDDGLPSVVAGVNYDIDNKEPYFTVSVSKTFDSYKEDIKLKELEVEKNKINYNKLVSNKDINIATSKVAYAELLKDYYNLSRQVYITQRQYEIYKVKEDTGLATYDERTEKYQDYQNAVLSYNKKRNELLAYKYKIEYRK